MEEISKFIMVKGTDEITVEILKDGTIKTTTNKISAANHANAEGFLAQVYKLAGGLVQRMRKPGASVHHHHGDGHYHSH